MFVPPFPYKDFLVVRRPTLTHPLHINAYLLLALVAQLFLLQLRLADSLQVLQNPQQPSNRLSHKYELDGPVQVTNVLNCGILVDYRSRTCLAAQRMVEGDGAPLLELRAPCRSREAVLRRNGLLAWQDEVGFDLSVE